MTSRAPRQQRGILPTYAGDDLSSSASVRRRMGIPSTLPGSLTSIILSPTRLQWIVIVSILVGLFIGARIAVPQLFHTSSDLIEPAAKADPTISILAPDPTDTPPSSPSASSTLPRVQTLHERNNGGAADNKAQLSIDTNAAVLPSARDIPPPRAALTNINNNNGGTATTDEWIPEGPFPLRTEDEEAAITESRRSAIRDAFGHAWSGYERYAFGHDELRPVTNATNDSWGKWGVTLIDALDTMIIMGFTDEVARARAHVATIDFDVSYDVSFFETSIRYLGGLLSAYELTRDRIYLTKAAELGDRLASSFDSTKTGLPQSIVNLKTRQSHNHNWNGGASILAEVGSVQLEFAYLAHHLNESHYNEKARKVFTILDQARKPYPGLYPVYIDAATGTFTGQSRISFGSLADSFYEYLLKLWVLTDKSDEDSLRMYNEAMAGFTNKIIHRKSLLNDKKEKISEWVFMGELVNDRMVKEQEHLTCFMPGLLALGGWHGLAHSQVLAAKKNAKLTPAAKSLTETAQIHIALAEELAATCAESYFQTRTGLGPESLQFDNVGSNPFGKANERASTRRARTIGEVWDVAKPKYILRPETLESLFILWRVTGDRKYREWGWHIFEALEANCRTPSSYSGLKDVDAKPNGRAGIIDNWDNSMQSFYFAETLKYLYLLFSPADVIPLDKFVFNTEAHPLGIIR